MNVGFLGWKHSPWAPPPPPNPNSFSPYKVLDNGTWGPPSAKGAQRYFYYTQAKDVGPASAATFANSPNFNQYMDNDEIITAMALSPIVETAAHSSALLSEYNGEKAQYGISKQYKIDVNGKVYANATQLKNGHTFLFNPTTGQPYAELWFINIPNQYNLYEVDAYVNTGDGKTYTVQDFGV
jgi:hypothetical protein